MPVTYGELLTERNYLRLRHAWPAHQCLSEIVKDQDTEFGQLIQ
jgi:hypothetical protein